MLVAPIDQINVIFGRSHIKNLYSSFIIFKSKDRSIAILVSWIQKTFFFLMRTCVEYSQYDDDDHFWWCCLAEPIKVWWCGLSGVSEWRMCVFVCVSVSVLMKIFKMLCEEVRVRKLCLCCSNQTVMRVLVSNVNKYNPLFFFADKRSFARFWNMCVCVCFFGLNWADTLPPSDDWANG